ncbi:MAG: hypothetical protein M1834_005892 [Cirrosporium novae-zelandiae]|nr:MAG: hypothetical protein M1834_005892 [Cirrosporium novae-zelandiae]
MIKPQLCQVVYSHLYPNPRPNDPTSFPAHVSRNIVPEVRFETTGFYGSLDCIEAQYPGLDYAYGPHRMRLSRFRYHRQLFRVFDELRLTSLEIQGLCRWEGTKWAKERYEKDENIRIRDTTGDEVTEIAAPIQPTAHLSLRPDHLSELSEGEDDEEYIDEVISEMEEIEGSPRLHHRGVSIDNRSRNRSIHDRDDSANSSEEHYIPGYVESDDDEFQSVGNDLTRQLLERTAARQQGHDIPLDEQWEQWLKDMAERGTLSDIPSDWRPGLPFPTVSSTTAIAAAPARVGSRAPPPRLNSSGPVIVDGSARRPRPRPTGTAM